MYGSSIEKRILSSFDPLGSPNVFGTFLDVVLGSTTWLLDQQNPRLGFELGQ